MRYMVISSDGCIEVEAESTYAHMEDGRFRTYDRHTRTFSDWKPIDAFGIVLLFKRAAVVFKKRC